jgi:hypothetical protein
MTKLLELHKLAAEAQIHQAKYLAGITTLDEYKENTQHIDCHCDIVVEEHHAEVDSHYREILDASIRLKDL